MYRTKELYNERNAVKQKVNFYEWFFWFNNNKTFINEREIWYIRLWINIWFEQDWKWLFRRPILVIKKIGNLFFVVPLSTKWKMNRYNYAITSINFNKPSSIILSQGRVIDKKRFMDYVWTISLQEFEHIKKLLKDMYF